MKRISFAAVVTIVLLSFARTSVGELIATNDASILGNGNLPQDGWNLTRDTDTLLDWLDLTLTVGRSFNDTSSQFVAGGDYRGFRFATRHELETLFDHAGLTLNDEGPDISPSIPKFLALFGFELAPIEGANVSAGRYDDSVDGTGSAFVGSGRVSDVLGGPPGSLAFVRIVADNAGGPTGALGDPSLTFPNVGGFLLRSSGDFNSDGVVRIADIDLLSNAVRATDYDALFDLDGNGLLERADRQVWVEDVFGTLFGDADLDKTVSFADFLALSNHFNMNGGWADGDFDGNGEVQFADFLLLSANYDQTATAVASVPEPDSVLNFLVAIGIVGWTVLRPCGVKRRRWPQH